MRKIIEYRIWVHFVSGGSDAYFTYLTLEEAIRDRNELLEDPQYVVVEEPLVAYEEDGKFYEAWPNNLDARTIDVLGGK